MLQLLLSMFPLEMFLYFLVLFKDFPQCLPFTFLMAFLLKISIYKNQSQLHFLFVTFARFLSKILILGDFFLKNLKYEIK